MTQKEEREGVIANALMNTPMNIIHKHGKVIYLRRVSFIPHVEDVTLEDLESCVSFLSGHRENCLFVFLKGGAKGRLRQRDRAR